MLWLAARTLSPLLELVKIQLIALQMVTTATTSQPSSTEKNLTLTGRKQSTFQALMADAGDGRSWRIAYDYC